MALLVLYPLVPESPHWLAVSGDVSGAEAVLRRMAAVNGAQLPPGRLEAPAGLSVVSAGACFCSSISGFQFSVTTKEKIVSSKRHLEEDIQIWILYKLLNFVLQRLIHKQNDICIILS